MCHVARLFRVVPSVHLKLIGEPFIERVIAFFCFDDHLIAA